MRDQGRPMDLPEKIPHRCTGGDFHGNMKNPVGDRGKEKRLIVMTGNGCIWGSDMKLEQGKLPEMHEDDRS